LNIVPTSTGADIAVSETIPSLSGKVKGLALRVPVADGSITDFSIETEKNTSAEEVNHLIKKAAEGQLKGIIQYSDEELVSTDIVGNPCSAIFDSKLTKVICNTHLKVVAWYDNEWGYSCRLVDLVKLVK
jgi:glyceraldehyde 3-phosphate dehydrogenase